MFHCQSCRALPFWPLHCCYFDKTFGIWATFEICHIISSSGELLRIFSSVVPNATDDNSGYSKILDKPCLLTDKNAIKALLKFSACFQRFCANKKATTHISLWVFSRTSNLFWGVLAVCTYDSGTDRAFTAVEFTCDSAFVSNFEMHEKIGMKWWFALTKIRQKKFTYGASQKIHAIRGCRNW